MMMTQYQEIIDNTTSYFRQQKVYSDELVFKKPNEITFRCGRSMYETLAELESSVKRCNKCKFGQKWKSAIIGEGNESAELMLIGKAPDIDGKVEGKLFIDETDTLLTKILNSIGFTRNEIYITNIFKCSLSENKNPNSEEIKNCIPYLLNQIKLIKPKIILTLGEFTVNTLLKTRKKLSELRKNKYNLNNIILIPTFHPHTIINNRDLKNKVWMDVKKLRNIYDDFVGDKPKWQPEVK